MPLNPSAPEYKPSAPVEINLPEDPWCEVDEVSCGPIFRFRLMYTSSEPQYAAGIEHARCLNPRLTHVHNVDDLRGLVLPL